MAPVVQYRLQIWPPGGATYKCSYPTQVDWDIFLRNNIRKGTMGCHIGKLSECKDDWILMVFICEAMVGLKGAPKSTNIYQKHGFL